MKLKFVNKHDRSVCSEGRIQGVSFAFCTLKDGVLETIMPISACKDYLNDVIYAEETGRSFESYRVNFKKLNLFDEGWGHLVMTVLKAGRGTNIEYGSWKKEVAMLDGNYFNLQAAINSIEKAF